MPKVSGVAKGQQKAKVTEEEQRSSWEVFDVIFELRSCPLSIQRLYATTVGT